ncbi:MAG: hypothetical protein J6U54_08095 [Clostridiales bacterium]|nr:hypothetical protein [Clostridiales bacterium]
MKMRTVVALLLMVSMLVGCGSTDKKSNVRHKEEEPSEITSESTEETTVETTAAPTPTSEPTEKPTPTPYAVNVDVDDLSMEEIRYLYRAFAEGLHKDEPDLKFGFMEITIKGDLVWVLATSDGNGTYAEYACVDGKMTDITNPDHADSIDFYVTSFDNFMLLPCVTELNSYTYDEVVESIDDGTYYGDIMAISDDGNYMLILAGEPVSFTQEEYDHLEVGDVVYHNDYCDEDVYIESFNDNGFATLSESDLWIAENSFTDDEHEYMLFSSSYNPVTVNAKVVVVGISPDCEIEDTYRNLLVEPDSDSEPEGYAEYLEDLDDPTVLEKTVYWFYSSMHCDLSSLGNGWTDNRGLLYPIVIKNGEATMMSLQWR